MKFEIKSSNMLKILKKIIKISPINSINEIFSFFLLEVEINKIIITTTNGEISMKVSLENNDENLKIIKTGAVLLNSKLIYEIFNKLEDEWILFELKINNLILSNFNNKNNDFIFKLITREEIEKFPIINFNKKNENKISFKKNILENINEEIAFATNNLNNNSSNSILKAINFKFIKNELFITATNNACLAVKKNILENELNNNKEYNIPVYFLSEVEKLISDLNGKINFYFENNQILIIESENFLFQAKIFEGTYPNTQKIINNFLNKEKVTIEISNLKDFLNVIELSIILSNKKQSPLIQKTIDIKNNELKINCLSNDNNIGEVTEQFKQFKILDYNEKNKNNIIKSVIKSKYIINVLKSFNKCNKIIIKILLPENYWLIESEEKKGLLHLISPIIEK